MNLSSKREAKQISILHALSGYSTLKGYLFKQGGSVKGWRKRWFCLIQNELHYFESAQETKLLGKFIIESDFTVTTSEVYNGNSASSKSPSMRKSTVGSRSSANSSISNSDSSGSPGTARNGKSDMYGIKIEGRSLNKKNGGSKARYLAAENEKQQTEWIQLLQHTVEDVRQGKHQVLCEGYLSKVDSRQTNWKRRYCIFKDSLLCYYKQPKDFIPCGIVPIHECLAVQALRKDDTHKPNCFALEHNKRMWLFHTSAEDKTEHQKWIQILRKSIEEFSASTPSISPSPLSSPIPSNSASPLTSHRNSVANAREVFITKPMKEGILYKIRSQIKKTKASSPGTDPTLSVLFSRHKFKYQVPHNSSLRLPHRANP